MQHFSRARQGRTPAGAVTFLAAPSLAAISLAVLGWGAFLSGCQKDAAKEQAGAPKPAATAAAAPKPAAVPSTKPKPPPVKQMEWDDPKQWKKIPASGMRYMSYQVPPVSGDKEIAELNVFVLGGDIESNIQRWVDEFSNFDAKTLSRSDRVVNDMTQAVVEIPKGTFDGGMGTGGPSDNFALLGAIVVTPENSTYFFKMTGPSATVLAARAPFYELLDSVRLQGGKAAPETAKTLKTIGGAAAPAAPPGAVAPGASAPANGAPPPKH